MTVRVTAQRESDVDISLSNRGLRHLADLIRTHCQQRRSRWRRLAPGRQALPALAHLRNGDALTRLAAGFEVGLALRS
ncbi:hypothetical protein FHX82_001358 [Amycolatopsis bartoniae]|uniref:Uncharacterized protein n=1 Tax=Amycolatopsis bartoniae TaxID=941986 RepID=A0A8H9IR74_9PSEU|nr:hypothetical protein [Amycolatopsis bartoniae]GHF48078.1 hypothetical protein GCM10017566_21730 [Amycolatopsis bartoniae]